jgi:hypothetical protein
MIQSLNTKQWARLPIPGATSVWLDSRIEGTISLVIGSWLTAPTMARSLHVMASFRTGAIGTYVDEHDISTAARDGK